MLVGCDNIILGKQWNVSEFINAIYFREVYGFNCKLIHICCRKVHEEHPLFFSQCIVSPIEVVMQQFKEK